MFAITANSTVFPDWVDTDAIVAGVEADFMSDVGNPMYQTKETAYQSKIAAMFAEDCQRIGPVEMGLTDRYTAHRVAREFRGDATDRRALLINSFR